MAQRCVVANFDHPEVTDGMNDPSVGNFKITMTGLYIDTAVAGSGKALGVIVILDSTVPAGWSGAIKAACAQIGNANGFSLLTVANVLVPTVG